MASLHSNLVSFDWCIQNKMLLQDGTKPASQQLLLNVRYYDPAKQHQATSISISKTQLQQIIEQMDSLHSQITAIIQK